MAGKASTKGKGTKGGRGGGRPTVWETVIKHRLDDIRDWIMEEGLTEKLIIRRLAIGHDGWIKAKADHPELPELIQRAKEASVDRIENALHLNATGYDYDEDTYERRAVPVDNFGQCEYRMVLVKRVRKHVTANTGAQCFILKNRRGDQWKDSHDHNLSGDIDIKIKPPEDMPAPGSVEDGFGIIDRSPAKANGSNGRNGNGNAT